MNTAEKRQVKLCFPLGLYLKQLFSGNTYVRDINPFSFWRRHQINHLETCHQLNTVRYLEHCYQLDYTNSQAYSPLEPAQLNIIYSPPQIELKYRGVIYYTKNTISVNIDLVEINSTSFEPSSFQHSDSFNDISTPETFGSN